MNLRFNFLPQFGAFALDVVGASCGCNARARLLTQVWQQIHLEHAHMACVCRRAASCFWSLVGDSSSSYSHTHTHSHSSFAACAQIHTLSSPTMKISGFVWRAWHKLARARVDQCDASRQAARRQLDRFRSGAPDTRRASGRTHARGYVACMRITRRRRYDDDSELAAADVVVARFDSQRCTSLPLDVATCCGLAAQARVRRSYLARQHMSVLMCSCACP